MILMDDAINALALETESYKIAIKSGMDPDAARRAVAHGLAVARYGIALENVERARSCLRDGNITTAMMFLDMCEDPRKETK